ncbi:hypothetical protein [Streptomyces sp. NPDC017202]|uniref:DUF7144 family membrane protein n=1 Tax=Streptomyces sp. NPDC017202 TaxID=3364981 RepID=UPI00379B1005
MSWQPVDRARGQRRLTREGTMADGGTPQGDTSRSGGGGGGGGKGGSGGPGGPGDERAGRERPPEVRPRGGPTGEIGTAWSVPRGGPRPPDRSGTGVGGCVTLAGTLMLCGGFLALLQGVAAIAEDDIYARVGSYVYGLSLTGWGWIHLVLGLLAAVTGASLLRGSPRARVPGVLLASLGLVAQFLFLPYEPLWSVVVMAVDVLVLRALASWLAKTG